MDWIRCLGFKVLDLIFEIGKVQGLNECRHSVRVSGHCVDKVILVIDWIKAATTEPVAYTGSPLSMPCHSEVEL